ncbi:MAG: hypothetical protein ACPGU1_09900 [Myxococcota bacterium]
MPRLESLPSEPGLAPVHRHPARVVTTLCLIAAIGGFAPACDEGVQPEPGSGGLGVSVNALTTQACSDGVGNGAALDEIAEVTIVVTGVDPVAPEGSAPTVLVNDTRTLGGESAITVQEVPEGSAHKLEIMGTTAAGERAWYAMEPELEVLRNEDNPVELLLTRYGGFNCAEATEKSYTNVVFPAIVTLGDGRIMASGGFTQIDGDHLAGASSQGIIYDPKTGEVTGPFDMQSENGRAGHAMVYMPDLEGGGSGQVLIIGGMTRLRVDEKSAFPFRPSANKDYVRNDVLVYDIDSNSFTTIADPMHRKRAFPRAVLMSDGTVTITGGGDWPEESDDEYRRVDVFDPLKDGGPGFLTLSSFESEVTRSGHAMAFLKNNESGQSHFLLWGGTSSIGDVAEILRQSPQQREGVDGTFAQVTEAGGEGVSGGFSTYFSELTPLSNDAAGRQRFLLTGGVRESGGVMQKPRADEAFILVYSEEGVKSNVSIFAAPGFGAGRVFHSAASHDGRNLSVVGGFAINTCGDQCNAFEAISDGAIRFWSNDAYDSDPSDVTAWSDAPDSANFSVRGGMAGQASAGGRVLLVGGEPTLDNFGVDTDSIGAAVIEVYTPSNLFQL